VRKAVIESKIELSSRDKTIIEANLPGGKKYQRELTRDKFEELIAPVLQRTVKPVQQALQDAGLSPTQIDEVVLVGGSTRIPRVRALVRELFKREPHVELNPDEVVALGAAVQANILSGGSNEIGR